MFKALFKKQFMEINTWVLLEKKTGKRRSKGKVALISTLYALVLAVVFGGAFYSLSRMLCIPLTNVSLDWLYYVIIGAIATLLGAFGSIFSTYNTLYLAKDNDLLMSLPLKPWMILTARLFGVWFWGFVYEAFVFIPAIIEHFIVVKSIRALLFATLTMLALSLFVLTLSCIVGYAVARVNTRLKNKSVVTVILSLVFFGAYYLISARVKDVLSAVLENAEVVADKIRHSFFPLYCLGKGCEGNFLYFILFAAMTVGLLALIFYAMLRSFSRIILSGGTVSRVKAKSAQRKRKSIDRALIGKELLRFAKSPNYMLNCGFGMLMLLIFGVLTLVKGPMLMETLEGIPNIADYIPVLACMSVCAMASMNDISAPSISLEGSSIWIYQSLPVSPRRILRAKAAMHIVLTEPSAIFCAACMAAAIQSDLLTAVLMVIITMLFVVISAEFGLIINLKSPNLSWTNELVPIKQSASVIMTLIGGWVFVVCFAGFYFLLKSVMSPSAYLAICVVAFLLIIALMCRWLSTRGAKIFSRL